MRPLPPLAIGVALAFWGWRSGHYATAGALALLLEAPRFVPLRFQLRAADFDRVTDLCAVLFAALLGWLFISLEAPRTARAVLTTVLWLPALLAPVLLMQRISAAGKLPLSALFLYLRRQRRREPAYREVAFDFAPVYFALCLVAACVPNTRDAWFYGAFAAVAMWALGAARPRHAGLASRVPALVVAALIGYGIQTGLAWSQEALEDWVSEWYLRGMASDPYRSTTEMGAVGRLKMVDAIVMRIEARPDAPPPTLLHRASYTTFDGAVWVARYAPMSTLMPQADGTSWDIHSGSPQRRSRIFIRLEGGKAMLALPPGTLRVTGMAASAVRRNALGATQADFGGDWAPYTAESAEPLEDYAAPLTEDLALPEAEHVTLERLATDLGLRALPPALALARVRGYLADFRYSTYREAPPPRGMTPLAEFLLRTRSGHCEYFAAATTLLLRAAGVPARYATGFAVYEYSPLESAYVVRARHAHAWARAHIDGQWIDVDTTPSSWAEEEERGAPFWQGAADFVRWAEFRWGQRGPLEAGAGWALILAMLVGIFVWRLLRGKRAARAGASAAPRRFTGADSEFYRVESALSARTAPRQPHESLAAWLARIAPSLDLNLAKDIQSVLALHYRYRFDPRGLQAAERAALREHCGALSARLESSHG
jgi:protein-glutamine gamma-glutamyltransferase